MQRAFTQREPIVSMCDVTYTDYGKFSGPTLRRGEVSAAGLPP